MPSHSYRCQLCGATFVCRANETDQLLRHANDVHPDVIGQYTIEGEILDPDESASKRRVCARWTLVLPTAPKSAVPRSRKKRSLDTTSCSGDTSSQGDSCSCTAEKESPTFWTTVETWRPGPSRIPCPNCGIVARPIVRRQKRRVSSSLPGALCILTCWPICFLPFMSGHGRLGAMKLYCASCDHFIALFDPDSETFARPSLCGCDVEQGAAGDTTRGVAS